jgi:hypothetical protein
MHPGSRVLWGCWAPLVILPRSPHLWQKAGLSVLYTIGETVKCRVGGGTPIMLFLAKKIPWWKLECETVHWRHAIAVLLSPNFGVKSLHSLLDPSRNRIRPDTWLQIKGCKNQHDHLAASDFEHWFTRYASASTITYHCTALHYYNCCTDGSTSPVNYGQSLIF